MYDQFKLSLTFWDINKLFLNQIGKHHIKSKQKSNNYYNFKLVEIIQHFDVTAWTFQKAYYNFKLKM